MEQETDTRFMLLILKAVPRMVCKSIMACASPPQIKTMINGWNITAVKNGGLGGGSTTVGIPFLMVHITTNQKSYHGESPGMTGSLNNSPKVR